MTPWPIFQPLILAYFVTGGNITRTLRVHDLECGNSFYVAAVVKPPGVCFFPPFRTLWHRASIALAPSCGVGTSPLARRSLRAGSHTRQPFLEAS